MINSISMKNFATFDELHGRLDNLNIINFVYGSNGSGKTSISNFCDDPNNICYKDCIIDWKNTLEEEIVVYNKNFRDKNFTTGKIKGVFTLGNATSEEIERIKILEEELKTIEATIVQKKKTIETQQETQESTENIFLEDVWKKFYKSNEEDFKTAFSGYMTKVKFRDQVLKVFKMKTGEIKTKHELINLSAVLLGKKPDKIELLKNIDYDSLINIEKNLIWKTPVIGKDNIDISKLIKKLNIDDWVNEGREYIEENSDFCPFCQQETISRDFRNKLEEYFDETYESAVQLVKTLCTQYESYSSNILFSLQNIEELNKVNDTSKLDFESFSAHLKTLKVQISHNIELINTKKKELSRRIEIKENNEQFKLISDLIMDCNDEINKHNNLVDNYERESKKLITDIWQYIVEINKEIVETYLRKINGIGKGIEVLSNDKRKLETNLEELKSKIVEARKNITSIQPTIDEINRVLKSFGYNNFQIVKSINEKNMYEIHRENGENATASLSEGEITFITFLYYLQRIKGNLNNQSVINNRVLIIDDPISSLDSNILFIVSSLLKNVIEDTKKGLNKVTQIIVLTHNVYFHKEISFINGRIKEINTVNYYIIRRNSDKSSIQGYLHKNPILSSYEILWRELKERDNASLLTIQNVMRRIIENYFKILGKYGDDDLIKKFPNYEEQEVCRSLICWINDGSHSIPEDIFIEQQEGLISKYMEVFRKIFEHTKHLEHYNMMMEIS